MDLETGERIPLQDKELLVRVEGQPQTSWYEVELQKVRLEPTMRLGIPVVYTPFRRLVTWIRGHDIRVNSLVVLNEISTGRKDGFWMVRDVMQIRSVNANGGRVEYKTISER
jgi:hypothetical protein